MDKKLDSKMDKRDRSANFSLQERDLLIELVRKHQNVLENKKSDATTWKKKEAAWLDIESEFNAVSGGPFRTSKTLKIKYEGVKRAVRKKSAKIRAELYRTGGGPNTAPPLDSVEERVKSLITLSADGLASIYDSDVIPSTSQNTEAHKNNDILQSLDIQNIKIPLSVGELEMQTQEVSVNQDTETEPLAEQSHILDTLIESQILPDQTGPETDLWLLLQLLGGQSNGWQLRARYDDHMVS